ncbi:unnamed protein product [Ostreobium quekettii]|uniref:Sugar phosphate transporter domain-containing protein n=1 Tax=Ostreobium quekettii TaxID=121088 RepID=A0A8S1IYR9_9CHLO|nr:unnamed protein product [Ostreobium quekettii]|eukprot:evm.model.scf_851.2 EVM.evm.TU.scf_851.2   scf_851:21180-25681(+)
MAQMKPRRQGEGKDLGAEKIPLLEVEAPQRYPAAFLRGAACVAASIGWMLASTALILLNKHLMVTDGFKYPMALSGMGMVFSSLASFLCCRVFRVVSMKASGMVTMTFYLQRILPVGLFMAATLLFGNMVYFYLTVSFIQMLKAFTPVITMVFLFAARLETPSRRMIYSVLLVAVGTAISSYGEVNLSVFGITVMFLSEAAEALRLVMTQYVLVGLKFHPIEGLMYFAPACTLWLVIGIAFTELRSMIADGAAAIVARSPLMYLTAACLGFAVNTLAYLVIILASSLTLKVLGTVKNTLLVLFCAVFLHETVTFVEGTGYGVSLAGFMWYNKIKMEGAGPGDKLKPPIVKAEEKASRRPDVETPTCHQKKPEKV